MISCQHCGAEIFFSDRHKSKAGKFIPLDRETGLPHECRASRLTHCMYCKSLIYFDDSKLSRAGKRIPMDYNSDQSHVCSDQERDWKEDQEYWRKNH